MHPDPSQYNSYTSFYSIGASSSVHPPWGVHGASEHLQHESDFFRHVIDSPILEDSLTFTRDRNGFPEETETHGKTTDIHIYTIKQPRCMYANGSKVIFPFSIQNLLQFSPEMPGHLATVPRIGTSSSFQLSKTIPRDSSSLRSRMIRFQFRDKIE